MKGVMIFLVLMLVVIMVDAEESRPQNDGVRLPPRRIAIPGLYIRFGASQDEVANDKLRRYYEN